MNIQLIQGQFNANDAIDIITKMIDVKIKYHENKINCSSNEEDVKMREAKIKWLQKQLFECRNNMADNIVKVKLNAIIQMKI